jgi:hypothetical protein
MLELYPLHTDKGKLQLEKALVRLPGSAELLELANDIRLAKLNLIQSDLILRYLQTKNYSRVRQTLIS